MDESGLYGYEEEFIIPEPDMIPVVADDNPGRTVDEMLALPLSSSVTVKKAVYAPVPETNQNDEQVGRFGSKEKASLRKGLNIPAAGIVYGSSKRRNVEEVRSLEVKKQEKSEMEVVSEQDFLAQIIAPKVTEVKMIEVVPAQTEIKPAETAVANAEQSADEVIETADAKERPLDLVMPPAEKAPVVDVIVAPLVKDAQPEKIALREIKKAPLPEEEDQAETVVAEQQEEIVLIPPVKFMKIDQEEEAPIVLIPPQKKKKTERRLPVIQEEERIVLIPPKRRAIPSVEVFLDE